MELAKRKEHSSLARPVLVSLESEDPDCRVKRVSLTLSQKVVPADLEGSPVCPGRFVSRLTLQPRASVLRVRAADPKGYL